MDIAKEKGYSVTIGLEIHAHLKTKTKMFSKSANNPDEEKANWNISPIDLAHPGTLPTINKKAVEHMVRIGLAVGGEIANFTEFDRKNYFYPDIPKGYQISQYKYPIVSGGSIAGFELERIHLEEDTGTLKHFDEYSLVDYNRAGSPLMELVTKPVLHGADDVVRFAQELQLLLRYLGASDAQIEKGQMRVEVNLSVSKTDKLGTKVEVKNIGSISSAGRATEYEIKRQIEVLESGGSLVQETRGWNEAKGETFSQRSKENAKDYRYFPEPDLPKLYLHKIFDIEEMRKDLPELPWEKEERFRNTYKLKNEDIQFYIQRRDFSQFFEDVASHLENDENLIVKSSNFILTNLVPTLREKKKTVSDISPADFASAVILFKEGKISSNGLHTIIEKFSEGETNAEEIAIRHELIQESNTEALEKLVDDIINTYQNQVEEYRNGKDSLLKFFIGMAMKESKGKANPEILSKLFKEKL